MDKKEVSIVLFKAGGKIMGFFEKLTTTINSTGKEVEQKAKMVSGTVKLNSQIKEINEMIQSCFKQVGELYYKKTGGFCEDEEIAALFEKIRKGKEDIQSAEREIETLKGIYRCKNCGAEMRITDNFCMMCGTKREDASQMIEEATVDSEAIVTDIDEKEPQEQDVEEKELQENEEADLEKEQTPDNSEEADLNLDESEADLEDQGSEEQTDVEEEWGEDITLDNADDEKMIDEAAKEADRAEAEMIEEEDSSKEESKEENKEESKEEDEEEGEGIDPADFEDGTDTVK